MIKLTDYRASVYEVQSALRNLSAINEAIRPRLIPDGIYGDETRAAVSSFQNFMGFEITGIVNFGTWQVLFDQIF